MKINNFFVISTLITILLISVNANSINFDIRDEKINIKSQSKQSLSKLSGVTRTTLDSQNDMKIDTLTSLRDVIGANWLVLNGITGKGVRVGVIDSGVTNSSAFSSRFIAASSFVTIDNGYSENDLTLTDHHNHGTQVANYALGLSSGIAPEAQLVSAKIFGDGSVIGNGGISGEETTLAILDAIEYMAEQNVSIINLSIGQYSNLVNDGRQFIIDKISREKGIVFVVAAGNEGYSGIGGSTIGTPGTAFQAITIGATTYNGLGMMSFSGSGFKVDYTIKPDVVAPGVSGTSFASPLVAGGVALLIQALRDNNLTVTPGAIKSALIESAKPIGSYPVWYQGAGLVNITAAYELLLNATLSNNVPDVVTAFPKSLPVKPLDNLFQGQTIGLNLTVVTSSQVTANASIEGIGEEFFSYIRTQSYNQSSRFEIYFTPPQDASIGNYNGNLTFEFSNGITTNIFLNFTIKEPILNILFDETKNGFVNEIKPIGNPQGYSSNINEFADPWGDQAFLLGAFRNFYSLLSENNIALTPFQKGVFTNMTYLDQFDIIMFPHPYTKLTNPFTDWWNDPYYGDTFSLETETLSFSQEELGTLLNYVDSGKGSILFLSSDPRHVNSTALNEFFDFFNLGLTLNDLSPIKQTVDTTDSAHQIFNSVNGIDFFGFAFDYQTNSISDSHYGGKFITAEFGDNKGKLILSGSAYFAENYMLDSRSSSNVLNNCKFILNMIEWLSSETSITTGSDTTTSSQPSSDYSTCGPSSSDTSSESSTSLSSSSIGSSTEQSTNVNSPGFGIISITIMAFVIAFTIRKKKE